MPGGGGGRLAEVCELTIVENRRPTTDEKRMQLKSRLVEIEDALMGSSSFSEPEKKKLLDHARNLSAEILTIAPNEPESHYIAGLTLYEIGFEHADGSVAERHFLEALSLDPNHLYARIYLGHYYFDNGNYLRALAEFELIDVGVMLAMGMQWRALKLDELRICCKLYLDSPSLRGEQFTAFGNEVFAADLEDIPVSSELIAALSRTGGRSIWQRISRTDVINLVQEICERLEISLDGILGV